MKGLVRMASTFLGSIFVAKSSSGLWKPILINATGPIIAVILGTTITGIAFHIVRVRRENMLLSLRRDQEYRELRIALSLEMMKLAYTFYYRTEEVIRQKKYEEEIHDSDLAAQYDEFRIAARVVEESLRTRVSPADARWYWHGVIDLLTVRFYLLVHPGQRLDDLKENIGKHHDEDDRIPTSVRRSFLNTEELKGYCHDVSQDVEDTRFASILSKAIEAVVPEAVDGSVPGIVAL
jgi:hypothetical protein